MSEESSVGFVRKECVNYVTDIVIGFTTPSGIVDIEVTADYVGMG